MIWSLTLPLAIATLMWAWVGGSFWTMLAFCMGGWALGYGLPTLAQRLPHLLSHPRVVDWLIRRAMRTPYTDIVSPEGTLYMERFWLFNPYPSESSGKAAWWRFPISIRLHHIVRPDQDRHLHDHPWNARTVILRGGYQEVRPLEPSDDEIIGAYILGVEIQECFTRSPGDTCCLRFGEYHRIISVQPDTWTLFITGRYRGTWGFLVDGVKRPWREYLGLESKP